MQTCCEWKKLLEHLRRCVCVCAWPVAGCCRCDWLTAVDNGSVLSGLWRRKLVNKEIGSTLHLNLQPTGPNDYGLWPHTHLIQKEPQTFTQAVCHSVVCQLGQRDPCQKLNVHPGRARGAHTHTHTQKPPQFNRHTPTSSVSNKHFRAVLQMLPKTYLISLFVLQIHAVSFTHAHNSQKLLHLQSGWQVYPAFAESCVWQI